jgi:outer membrane biogenesis lipoprotein LolB
MNFQPLNYAKLGGFILLGIAALLLSSCVGLSPQQQADNAVTRHEQQAEGIQDPMKQQ